jgi:hypothetical protein
MGDSQLRWLEGPNTISLTIIKVEDVTGLRCLVWQVVSFHLTKLRLEFLDVSLCEQAPTAPIPMRHVFDGTISKPP